MNAPLDAAADPYVLADVERGVATLTLNRGARYNALSRAMLDALAAAFALVGADPTVRAVVLAGAGNGFCAGHDLKELRAHADETWQRETFAKCSEVMLAIARLPQPVIARVHGIATAAGCQLVAGCDLAVASEHATFALPGVNVGVFCTSPAVAVGRNISRKRSMEMLLTGEPIDARTALAWGLVNRVVPASALDGAIRAFTDLIASKSARLIAEGKAMFYRQVERGVEEAYGLACEAMTRNLLDPVAHEGIDAFVAKRAPSWGD